MNWTIWTILYLIAGFICYVIAATLVELDYREKNKHMSIDDYATLSVVVLIWPLLIVIACIALFYIGIMFICQRIADYVESCIKKEDIAGKVNASN